jgi:hypothetical protein
MHSRTHNLLTANFAEIIMDSLHFQGMEHYHERPLESHPGTFDWIFDQESRLHRCDFNIAPWEHGRCATEQECHETETNLRKHATKLETWLETSGDIFWVSGKAGSGKSTFMKFSFEHDQTQVCLRRWSNGKVVMAAFFLWGASSSELEKSYIGLLRALLHQILLECPGLIQQVLPERWQAASRSTAYPKPWTRDDLLAAFAHLLDAVHISTSFCFLVDGLHEFDGDLHDLIDAIRLLNRSPAIKICVSSRPWNIFQQAYGTNDDLHIALHSLTKRDIDQYVRARLRPSVPATLDERELRRLGNALCEKAEGVFLWVTLAVRDLRRGIGEHDSAEMLQIRLNEYPSELHEFLKLNFDRIDPVYKKLTGRMLLIMLVVDRGLPLISVSFLEQLTANKDIIIGTRLSAKSDAEMHRLVDRAVLCTNKWCRDLVQPLKAPRVHDAISNYQSEMLDEYSGREYGFLVTIKEPVTFGHRSIHQFVQQRAHDGTLAEMAGHNFSPCLTSLCLSVQISRYALDICNFAAIFEHAIRLSPSLGFSDSIFGADSANQTDQCLVAFETMGQAIEKPIEWSHWTTCQFAELDFFGPTYIHRAPSSHDYTSLVSYCVSLAEWSTGPILDVAMGRLYESLSSNQKQFVLETALLPQFYHGSHHEDTDKPFAPTEQYYVAAKTLASGIDVNRPTPRIGCRTDYSVWQFYLLWVHDWMYQYDFQVEEYQLIDGMMWRENLEFLTNVFQLFLQSGADPCAVISRKDLVERWRGNNPTTKGHSRFSVADILEDWRTVFVFVSTSAFLEGYPERLAAWEDAMSTLEKSLQEAVAQ